MTNAPCSFSSTTPGSESLDETQSSRAVDMTATEPARKGHQDYACALRQNEILDGIAIDKKLIWHTSACAQRTAT